MLCLQCFSLNRSESRFQQNANMCYLCDLWTAPRGLDDDVPALGSHSHGDGVRQHVDPLKHLLAYGGAESDILRKIIGSYFSSSSTRLSKKLAELFENSDYKLWVQNIPWRRWPPASGWPWTHSRSWRRWRVGWRPHGTFCGINMSFEDGYKSFRTSDRPRECCATLLVCCWFSGRVHMRG